MELPHGLGVRPGAAARAAALLVALVVVAGSLAFPIDWSLDVAGWLALAATFAVVGAAVVARVPDNAFGWLVLAIAAASAVTVGLASGDVPDPLAWVRSWIFVVPVVLVPVALLLYPTGALPSARWRPVLALAIAGAAGPAFFFAVASAIEPDPLGVYGPPGGAAVAGLVVAGQAGMVAAALALLLSVASLLARLRGASPTERRQVLCLMLGGGVMFAALALEVAGVAGAWVVGAPALPIAVGVAMLWHRLYDLDLFMNRSAVYVALSAVLLATFGAIVVAGNLLAGDLLPAGGWTLVAVGLVALAVDPLRRRLQAAVDRLLYGDRKDPYAVVTSLERELHTSAMTPGMLADIAETVARSLALPFVAIETRSQDGAPETVTWGRRYGEPIAVALNYRGERIGRLLVTPRTVRGRLSERDRRLLDDIAHSVALALHAIETSARLQRAREQLVSAREEERRRLRRDLHDGLGPALAGIVMQVDAATNVLRRDASAVAPVLAGLRVAAQDAIGDVRRLVYELRPPALDELGLIGAIREWTERFAAGGTLRLDVDAPSRLPALSAAVEVAALRIVQEAVANVAHHAQAASCRIVLAVDGALAITVQDDGRGLPADRRRGVGTSSMSERAAEVGGACAVASPAEGGTRVHAILPLATT